MKTIIEKVSGSLIVCEDTTYHYLSAVEVTIRENVVTRIFGVISDKLVVEKNAIVYLHGRCDGEIINNGGVVYRFLPSGYVDRL